MIEDVIELVWNPVSDEEEPPGGWVLISVEEHWGRDVRLGNWDGYRKQWRSRLGWKIEGEITHWMALPEPPEE